MIIKSYELEKKRLDQSIYLLYGDNEGYKEEIIKSILQKFNFKKFTYFEKDILNDKENFFNLLFSKSFFESEKIILKSLESKIDFYLEGHIKEVDDKNTQFHIEFKGQLNPMMEIMVKTPLQTFINDLSKNIANLN